MSTFTYKADVFFNSLLKIKLLIISMVQELILNNASLIMGSPQGHSSSIQLLEKMQSLYGWPDCTSNMAQIQKTYIYHMFSESVFRDTSLF